MDVDAFRTQSCPQLMRVPLELLSDEGVMTQMPAAGITQ